ncbi:UNVERIFIED_CONTAM: hypothetical protein RMT77_016980 [Armadillidium vulgare]
MTSNDQNSGMSDMEARRLDNAKKQRKLLRSRATKSVHEIDRIIGDPEPQLGRLIGLVKTLESIEADLRGFDTIIQESLDDDALSRDDDECFERQMTITDKIETTKLILEPLKRESAAPTLNSTSETPRVSEAFKLPTKRLPTFDGDILTFSNFIEVFETNVENKGFSEINKLNLLLDCLKGPALKLVSGYAVTASNYKIILNLLKRDFGNPAKVKETLITKLLNVPPPKYDYSELYQYKADIHCYVESLKTKGMISNCDSCSTLLGVLLAKKLPAQIREKILWENSKDKSEDAWTLESLMDSLNQTLTVLEASGQSLSSSAKNEKTSSKNSDNNSSSNNKWRGTGTKSKQSTVLVTTQSNLPPSNKSSQKSNNNHSNNNSKNNSGNNGHIRGININSNNNQNNNNNTNSNVKCRFCRSKHYTSECSLLPSLELRRQVAEAHQWCLKCLASYHPTNECQSNKTCFNCKSPEHHTALCDQFKESVRVSLLQTSSNNVTTTLTSYNSGVALPIADVTIFKDRKPIVVRTLCDQASQRTLVARSISNLFNCVPDSKINIAINGINHKGTPSEHDIVTLNIKTKEGVVPVSAVVVDYLPNDLNIPGLVKTTTMLRKHHIPLANPYPSSDRVSDIGILLGADHLYKFLKSFEKVHDVNLMKTNLGHIIWGQLPFTSSNSDAQVTVVSSFRTEIQFNEDINNSHLSFINDDKNSTLSLTGHEGRDPSYTSSIDEDNSLILPGSNKYSNPNSTSDLDSLWSLSHIGILPNEQFTDAEKTTLESFKDNLRFENGRYVVSLPWRDNHPPLPDNYSLSKCRLYSVLKKLRENPQLLKSYDDVVKDQLSRDFIEEVKPSTPLHPESKLHYLPHHGVRKSSSTTALRLVYDCSSGNPSLNHCLHSGPSLITDLGKLLLKFRIKPYATSSDIEKAFLGIRLAEKDRDSTRFLWVRDPSDPHSPLATYRFKSVLFGATCSPFLLAACLHHHVNQSEITYKDAILEQIYVDNLFGTFETEEEIGSYFTNTRSLFNKAGLNLREWASNSPLATSIFQEQNLGIDGHLIKMLGMEWDVKSDTMSYPSRKLNSEANTKRRILQNVASIFDPLGVLSPVVIRGKILLQKIWKLKLNWDTKIPDPLQREWKSISNHLQNCLSFKLPRQLIHTPEVELHAFSDASGSAYATVVYVVSCLDTNPVSNLLISKVKVAPIKELSIPRLELMGALLSSRILKFVVNTFDNILVFRNIYAWIDSQVALQWLYSKKQLPTFNQNRVDEIHKNIPTAEWKYVPTECNPADLASRGSDCKYIFSKLWGSGPPWLLDPPNWPIWKDHPSLSTGDEEIPVVATTIIVDPPQPRILNLHAYSSLTKALRITKLIIRFVNNLKNVNRPLNKSIIKPKFSHQFSIEENRNAELYWIRTIQREYFESELNYFKNDLAITPLCKQLSLILVDGIIRCDRRLSNSSLPYDTKFPILLPFNCHFTRLLIWDTHLLHHHLGTSELLLITRRKYYFSRMRTTIKKVTRPCMLCKRLQAVHFRPAPLAALPKARVANTRPFTVIGVDLTGFFLIKTPKSCTTKCYIVLFTCATTRAVHLELVLDNSTESFLLALRRFMGRRGVPSIVFSDNATYFQASSQYLKQLHNLPSVKDFLSQHSITWRFNPARSSHYGGFFERLIGMTKLHLKRTLNKALISYDEFYTVLTEVESVLNCRPLTFVGDELQCEEPLTPSHLLMGYKLNSLPIPLEISDTDTTYMDPVKKNKRYRYLLSLISKFRSSWEKDYLINLKQSWNVSGKTNISIGDVVLIEDDGPRLKWRLGIIKTLHTSPDGHVRSVSLTTRSGEITRAVIHLYPLEIHSNIYDPPSEELPTTLTPPRRSERQANVLAKQRIKAILDKE